ncbi:ABC transporter ATP-binding protein [Motiliproteus sp. SC1-56]|uniref:ABC transporter ATP-binding protein n=1 Tax=Motiliproteus sp. SC1-56 TaxID=2799565 RepID=UPI001A8E0404|nr:ABC transporter ATP-binding protein [Motiliproteus sp. SC1-56]
MIRLDAVEKRYQLGARPFTALQPTDLEVSAGEYLAITGPSGSGKSTLLNLIGLLDRPDAGQYCLDGQATENLQEEARAALRRRYIGFVFQAFHLVARLSAFENVELPLMLAGVPRRERRPRIEAVLARIGLSEVAEHRPGQLSGGQNQRVAIARAIVMNPRLLLADEPTGNLDQAAGAAVVELLEGLNRDGMTVLMVTHNPELAARCRRRIRLVDGCIVEDSPSWDRSTA